MEETLLNAIETFEQGAERSAQLSEERAKAMDFYLGRPFGNEVTGRSQVVSRDVADSIEWIKPGILRVFTSGDDMLTFDPRNPEDVESSQQETDYVNYIITQKNNWFNAAYVWFTDALIQKNGYVKAYWDERIESEKETYKGLTDDQLALVMQDAEVEVVEHNSYEAPYLMPTQPGQPPQQTMVSLHDVKLAKNVTYGCVKYVNLPPERVIVSVLHQCIDLDGADFVEHWEYKTLSELRKEGFEVPDDLADMVGNEPPTDSEEQARNVYNQNLQVDSESNDPAMRRVKARECWLRFDEDEDGIAELRHCMVVGTTILLNEEADLIPIAAITPRIMPHRHIGISVSDSVMDIQLIKSTLQRGYLDNVHFAINGRNAIDKNKVNLEDMLTVRPAGVVRVDGSPGDAILPMAHSSNFESVLAGIQYFDGVREERTGSSKQQQLSPDVLKQAPSGVAIAQLMNAGQALVELIARTFAETGVKRLFQIIHALTLKNATKQEVIRLRNKWVTVDPRQWKTRYDMTVSVGLGNGNKEMQVGSLQQLVAMELQMLPLGLSNPKTIRHALTKLTNAQGFKDTEAFWVPLEQIKPPQQQQDPKMAVEGAKLQFEGQQSQQQKQFDAQMEQMKGQNAKEIEALRIQHETIMKDREQAFDKWKAELESATRITIAQISAKSSIDAALMSAESAATEGVNEELSDGNGLKASQNSARIKRPIDELTGMHAQQMEMGNQTLQAIASLAQVMASPKEIVRGPDGKAIGVQPRLN